MALKYHTVAYGDTLGNISTQYGDGLTVPKLMAMNGVVRPDGIVVGQKVHLTVDSAKEDGVVTVTQQSNVIENITFGIQSTNANTLYASWAWARQADTESYTVEWTYATGDKAGDNLIWFSSGSGSTSIKVDKDNYDLSRTSTYSIPSNATQVRFRVKAIPKKSNAWTPDWSEPKYYDRSLTVVGVPPAPAVTINKYKLTAKLENLTIDVAKIQFEVYKNDSTTSFSKKTLEVNKLKTVSYVCDVDPGAEYRVRCRGYKNSKYGDWSPLSSAAQTIPSAPTGFTICRANSTTSVYLEWNGVSAAKTYEIEYTTKLQYFDGSTETTTVSTKDATTHFEVTGLESGQEYFFRLRAVNDAQPTGESSWSGHSSVIIGKAPAAPTTWSSTTTAVTGEPLTLYWVHNAQDGSSQTLARLEITVNGITTTKTIENSTEEDEKDKTSYYAFDTSTYIEGTKIEWRVKTAGITKDYGEWSITRTVDIYAPPTLDMSVTNKDGESFEVLTSFPINVRALAGPNTQVPTGYQLIVTSNNTYDTVDQIGNPVVVNAGDQLYSKHIDTVSALQEQLSANNLDLANGMTYTITCIVSMNSGLTATATFDFTVSWSETSFIPNAQISIDEDTLTTIIRPYCEDMRLVKRKVSLSNGVYSVTDETIDFAYGQVNGALTTTGELVYEGVTGYGDEVYFSYVEERATVENVLLSVYRREFDGSFTELATELHNLDNTNITDPHPALDYARYRIVATNIDTGAVGFYDVPGVYIGGDSVVIQWSEDWVSFNTTSDEPMAQPSWAGSMLKIPYDIDISDKFAPDVSMVEYVGRKHPVSYYGTQLGVASTWKFNIPSTDIETLYALRRLAIWQGDVYVREPSGSGYWAHVVPSWDQTHCSVTIPVTMEVTRVEGGM